MGRDSEPLSSTADTKMSSTKETPAQAEQEHIDLNGNVFTLPKFTIGDIRNAIPAHCYQPSTTISLLYVLRDLFYTSVVVYASSYITPAYIPSFALRSLAWMAYMTAQGIVFTGIWILAHECGHGAFSKSKQLNACMGWFLHSLLLVPFFSWKMSHSKHHKTTGCLERDTAFVPHTRASWIAKNLGREAVDQDAEHPLDLAHLAEDAPIVTLWKCFLHQAFGWPGYLLFNLTGRDYKNEKGESAGFPYISHFWFGESSAMFKGEELRYVLISDVGVLAMLAALWYCASPVGLALGWAHVGLLFLGPWMGVNNWIAITFLQHTAPTLPHYSASTHTFLRGATATIDRDLGFIDTHFFHSIISTHVCHHLISSIPFYRAHEATIHVKRVMGQHYNKDERTGLRKVIGGGVVQFWEQFWRCQRACRWVEETVEGSGVWMFRNGREVVRKVSGGEKEQEVVVAEPEKEERRPVTTGMSVASGGKRRFSHSVKMDKSKGVMPLLAEVGNL